MGASYSKDLRLRMLAALDQGMSKWQVHKTFGISRSTIDQWLKLRAETGEVAATTHYRRGPLRALEDGPELRAVIEDHRSNTLEQLSDAWLQEKGQRLRGVTIPTR